MTLSFPGHGYRHIGTLVGWNCPSRKCPHPPCGHLLPAGEGDVSPVWVCRVCVRAKHLHNFLLPAGEKVAEGRMRADSRCVDTQGPWSRRTASPVARDGIEPVAHVPIAQRVLNHVSRPARIAPSSRAMFSTGRRDRRLFPSSIGMEDTMTDSNCPPDSNSDPTASFAKLARGRWGRSTWPPTVATDNVSPSRRRASNRTMATVSCDGFAARLVRPRAFATRTSVACTKRIANRRRCTTRWSGLMESACGIG